MIAVLRGSGLALLTVALVLPSFGADTPSRSDTRSDKKKDVKKEAVDEYVTIAQFEGVVVEPGGKLRLTVITKIPDPAALNRMAQLQAQLLRERAQGNARNGFNAAAIARTTASIQQQQAAIARGKEQKEEKTFEVAEDARVRVAETPVEFDDKGNRKKLTPAQLKEKKGPGNLWGYTGSLDQIVKGQSVKVFVGQKKSVLEAAKKKKKPAGKAKPKADDDPMDENGPVVHMIYVLADVPKSGN